MSVYRILKILLLTQCNFGTEEPLATAPNPKKYHHEGLTRQAAGTGWSAEARNAIAFHTDYVDSYQYSPLWWADLSNGGGLRRVEISLCTQKHLAKLHFDDLFNNHSIAHIWRRTLSGTVCGLLWARNSDLPQEEKISCAHNLIGAGLHGIQDFYSHSNWVDLQARRGMTWFEAATQDRFGDGLYTGSYEAPEQHGIKAHGEFQFECDILKDMGFVRQIMEKACHAISPLSKSTVCRLYNRCRTSIPLELPPIEGIPVPRGIGHVSPGINLDSRWQAVVGVRERGLDMKPWMDSDEAFETAYNLAARSSCQWLKILETVMVSGLNYADFWNDITSKGVTDAEYKSDVAPFERMDLLPYLFLTAGDYPPDPEDADAEKWYLRLTVHTSDIEQADTDADIIPVIDGVEFEPLDYKLRKGGSIAQAGISYNDFQRNERTVYVVGPLSQPPQEVILRNTAPSASDIPEKLWSDLVSLVEEIVDWIGDALLTIIAGHADEVARSKAIISADQIRNMKVGTTESFAIDCNGKSEGHYTVHGTVTATGTPGEPFGASKIPTQKFRVTFTELVCEQESKWDRGSDSDEPFVIGMVLAHGGKGSVSWRTSPFEEVNSGTRKDINQSFDMDLIPNSAQISLPVVVYEHDDETAAARDELRNKFHNEWVEKMAAGDKSLLSLIAASLGPKWHCHEIEAVAFRRSLEAEVIQYAPNIIDRWIDGGDDLTLRLTEADNGRHTVHVPDSVHALELPDPQCPQDFKVPPLLGPPPQTWVSPDSTPGGTEYRDDMFDNRDE